MGLWVNDPKTKEPSTTLTFSVMGLLITTAVIAAYLTLGRQLSDATGVLTSLLSVTIGAYTARKFTDAKYNNGNGQPKENGQNDGSSRGD